MRLGIAEFSLESVTFLPETTGIDVFEEGARAVACRVKPSAPPRHTKGKRSGQLRLAVS